MGQEKSVSFRTHLQSNVQDLLADLGLACVHTIKLVVALVSRLAAYTEEGAPMAPTVFVCNSISELLKRAGAGQHIVLAERQKVDGLASTILKLAAPVCSDDWKIYVERIGDGTYCNFGVFCGAVDPAALTVAEVVLTEADPTFPIVCIAQTVTNKVAVATSDGHGIEFRFNDDADVDQLDRGQIAGLASIIAGQTLNDRAKFEGLLARVITNAVRSSHGTLIAVLAGDATSFPEFLADVTAIKPPLDLYEKFAEHVEANSSGSTLGRLRALCELLGGFVRSDGITVFNQSGQVLGYRAFVKTDSESSAASGGARTRAYMALKGEVGSSLSGAFFRSQDGRMELSVVSEVSEQ